MAARLGRQVCEPTTQEDLPPKHVDFNCSKQQPRPLCEGFCGEMNINGMIEHYKVVKLSVAVLRLAVCIWTEEVPILPVMQTPRARNSFAGRLVECTA